ncbi:MAG: hypothetical protein U0325_19560 [Polyangiales bacterium]
MTRVRLLLAALALVGCGAVARRSGDGGVTDAPRAADTAAVSDAGGACPSRVAPGVACAPGTRPCLGDDRCNDCFCNGGAWVCGSRVCVDAGVCPAGRPRTGDPCDSAGQACSYGAGCAGAECLCAGGRWTCDAFYCPDR